MLVSNSSGDECIAVQPSCRHNCAIMTRSRLREYCTDMVHLHTEHSGPCGYRKWNYDAGFSCQTEGNLDCTFASLAQRQHVGLAQCSYTTLGPVSAWMGDRLRMGKLPQNRTRHPGLLRLSHPSEGRHNEYPTTAGVVNRHIPSYTSPYPRSHSVGWCLAEWII